MINDIFITERSSFFSGPEELRTFEVTGQLMRMGALQHLSVSDKKRVESLLDEGSTEEAIAYIETLFTKYMWIVIAFAEWCLHCSAVCREHISADLERNLTRKAHALWHKDSTPLAQDEQSAAVLKELFSLFTPEYMTPETVAGYVKDFQEQNPHGVAFTLVKKAQKEKVTCVDSIKNKNTLNAKACFHRLFVDMRTRHDAFAQYTSAYAAVVHQKYGQEKVELLLEKSFSGCSFYDGLFGLATSVAPDQLAAFYAEHLRTHFSGEDRDGKCEVVEDEKSYRLVFNTCGSGGAMRQRMCSIDAQKKYQLPKASPVTWGRENEVPFYCSHCAKNELKYIDMIGYPVAVTEFDPDPHKPCGWTIYKNPHDIPESYFTRLGLKKDPSKFKKSY